MKKILLIMMSLLLSVGVFTGCGNSGDEEGFDYDNDITVISREDGSGTRGAFIELFEIEEKSSDGTKTDHTTEEAVIVSKTGIVLQNVAGDLLSIGYVSLGSLNDTVKAIKINGVEATAENVKNGTYEVKRPFNIATKGTISDVANDFITFIMSAEGQNIVLENGYIKVDDAAASYTSKNLSGKIVVAGSSSVSPVMEKLAEAYQEINGDVKIEIQTSDSTTGMQNAIDGSCDIGMASRDLKDSEKSELQNKEIALDGIAVVVNPENPITDLTKDQVKEIFTGSITSWIDFK